MITQITGKRPPHSEMLIPTSWFKALRHLLLSTILLLLLPCSTALAITPPEIRGQNEIVISKDMHGLDLKGYEFVKADLRGVDLGEADLRGAVFNNSQLQEADLKGADMEDVVAFASLFEDADLRQVNFTSALLMESIFTNAQIDGADFSEAVLNRAEQKQLCARAQGTNLMSDISTSESLGC